MRSRLAAAATLAGASLVAVPAYADHYSIHFTLAGTLAATNNVFNAPDGQPADGDLLVQIRPGALFVYESPRMIEELVGEVELIDFLIHNDQPSIGGHAAWRQFFTPGPLSTLSTTVDAQAGEISALTSRSAPDTTGVALQPSSLIYDETANVSESINRVASLGTSVHETAALTYGFTTDNGDNDPVRHQPNETLTEGISLIAGVTRSWPKDSLSFDVGGQFLHLERAAPLGSPPGSDVFQRQVNPQATVQWRHDFDRHWSGGLLGGIVIVNPVGTDPFEPMESTSVQFFPVGTVQAAYTSDWGKAILTVGRNVAPDLFIAANTVNDTALLQLSMPISSANEIRRGPPHLLASSSLGVSRTTIADGVDNAQLAMLQGVLAGSFDLIHLDAGVSWTPKQDITYGLRFEYLRQVASAEETAMGSFFSFARSTLFFTVAIRYPARVVAQIPLQNRVRADNADTATPGEVVVPEEPTEETGGPDAVNNR
jgi:hypothetical protein